MQLPIKKGAIEIYPFTFADVSLLFCHFAYKCLYYCILIQEEKHKPQN